MENVAFPSLEEACKKCGGSGIDRERNVCRACDGRAYLPTAFGKKVLLLVKRNITPVFRHESEDHGE